MLAPPHQQPHLVHEQGTHEGQAQHEVVVQVGGGALTTTATAAAAAAALATT